jgi:hypothetical protein
MTNTELADAMLQGAEVPNVREDVTAYISASCGICYACALGAALIGANDGDYKKAVDMFNERFGATTISQEEIMASLLNIPVDLARSVSSLHYRGVTIQDIARSLKKGCE